MDLYTKHKCLWRWLIKDDRFTKAFKKKGCNLLLVGKDLREIYDGTWDTQTLNLALVALDWGGDTFYDLMEELGCDSPLQVLFQCLQRHPNSSDDAGSLHSGYDETTRTIKVGTSDGPLIILNIWPLLDGEDATSVQDMVHTLLYKQDGAYYTHAVYFEDSNGNPELGIRPYNIRRVKIEASDDKIRKSFKIHCDNYQYEGKNVDWMFYEYTRGHVDGR